MWRLNSNYMKENSRMFLHFKRNWFLSVFWKLEIIFPHEELTWWISRQVNCHFYRIRNVHL
ncbi:unnamed protein product, partial [Hymenolepis diminuta]